MFNGDISPHRATKDIVYKADTLFNGNGVTVYEILFGAGYLFHISDKYHCTPYFGLSMTDHEIPPADTAKGRPDIPFNALYGPQLGVALDLTSKKRNNIDAIPLGIRLDGGVRYNAFSKIDKAAKDGISYYLNLSFEIIGWFKDKDYSMPVGNKKLSS
jgi:hypothetical protein